MGKAGLSMAHRVERLQVRGTVCDRGREASDSVADQAVGGSSWQENGGADYVAFAGTSTGCSSHPAPCCAAAASLAPEVERGSRWRPREPRLDSERREARGLP